MRCEKCGKIVTREQIKANPLSEYLRHKRCGGTIAWEAVA